jgi:enamine deaminase RidA (YjgF/YER057c/UK114 family)
VNKRENPYTPGAGRKPPVLAGRDPDLENVQALIERLSAGGYGAGYAAFQRVWGDRPHPPVITAAVVKGLGHPEFLVEMDAIAVVPA